ncbi:sorting nexin mvp1 [Tothia fuscella]|uniref:Sorting nexin MVP1 n=1 Tax=Tothia fuscella TaxID=1048955 RepID=A0A9P4NQA6_9PEZI|nr:sorting nexin mvp1 [Tothia fuscella]
MSLFGEFPNDPPVKAKASNLFDERPSAGRSTSSLFADETDTTADPWAFPTPKKAGRAQLVKGLLPASQVPESYIDAFDSLAVGGVVEIERVRQLLEESGLDRSVRERILAVTLPNGTPAEGEGIGRGEFNVLLALVGLGMEGDDITLDGVDERRRNLPEPDLPSLKKSGPPAAAPPAHISTEEPVTRLDTPLRDPASAPPHTSTPSRAANLRKESFGYDADPWASPDMHRGHNHTNIPNGNSAPLNGSPNPGVERSTSAFTTTGGSNSISERSSGRPTSTGAEQSSSWGNAGYTPSTSNSFHNPPASNDLSGGGGFGTDGANDPPQPSNHTRNLSTPRPLPTGVEENVTVTAIAEKEGMFMFQHRNYEVASPRRGSKVVRRYSDFVWLLDCLHKKFPFRQLPLLPPKRVGINGNYLAADSTFVEKRRRGLSRFCNVLVRHPILSQEQLVIMFLTVPTELSVWRKQANLTVVEEFTGKPLPPNLEDSLPQNLQETFDTVRSGVRRSAEVYIQLCSLVERLTKRNEGIAAEYQRFSLSLSSLAETSKDTYALDTNDVPLLNEGMLSTAKCLSNSKALLEDEAGAWDGGVLEDLKRVRDGLVSVRDMFDRRDRFDRDSIPALEKRIAGNEAKLGGLRGKPENQVKPGEIEKVEDAISRDKQSIVTQHARGVFIKECIRDELNYFQSSQYMISRLHQDWAQERVKYAELQADCWRSLVEMVEGMPGGDS